MKDRQPSQSSRPATQPDPVIKPDPKETAQEAVHQVMPKSEVPKDLIQKPSSTPKTTPMDTRPSLAAAKGNDEVMSQPPDPLKDTSKARHRTDAHP